MRSNISLPVIQRVTIRNFALYPGINNAGLDITFADGISVIAGINGIGKTTLLTLLLRMILGPNDPEKATRSVGRVSQRRLVGIKKFDFFSKRVPGALGEDSFATLYFTLGKKNIEVSRYMRDLKIKSVRISGKKYEPQSETDFIDFLGSLSGLLSGYDFHMVVRYLQFFGEDRIPLLWDAGAQFEFFKILFLEETVASSLNDAFAQIQKIDTDYRNRLHQLNKRKESLPPATPNSAHIELETLDKMIQEATEAHTEAESQFLSKKNEYDELQKQLRKLDNMSDEAQIELAQLELQFSQTDAMFILQALPSLHDKEMLLMQGYATGCGCFICGSKSKKQLDNIGKKIRKGHCFACDATINNSKPSNVTPISSRQVRTLEEKIEDLRNSSEQIEVQRSEIEQKIHDASRSFREAVNLRNSALHKREYLEIQRPSQNQKPIVGLQAEIDREQDALDILAENRREFTARYRTAVDRAQDRMGELKGTLESALTSYATAFLQEEVKVAFSRQTPFKIATGADRVNIPTFTINMTSSTHKIAHERLQSNSVSESQKEFLDLAFRMTLLDMVNDNGSIMLVIETPEASLDSWFMRRAADLMRRFAPENTDISRKVIATSNVNGTQMIPALLGLVQDDGTITKLPAERENHLINLLDLTPPPAALDQQEVLSLLSEELGKFLHAK
ncbi:AAA family ATPase [Pseudomonas fluorescens]|uniref:AAA family ATPase n=1 Tax=Pseudomonas fluorescens TaxID=294 RepID=UPI001405595D|nr:AAA family ATPase [Pseudomonas fluorescens]NHN69936.1 AAA family ATPase [Pseudomonas fluorescens]